MAAKERTFCIEYTYGPYVGRRYISALTAERATELLWAELQQVATQHGPIALRYRKVTKIEET